MLLAALLATLIGLALGLLGGGGSILTVPVFVYALGLEPKEAIVASLAVVGATSLFGAVGHWRAGNVDVRVASLFGAVAMVGTYAGARLAVFVSGTMQLALFAIVMLLAAALMLRPPALARVGPEKEGARRVRSIVAEGFTVGMVTGLVGVGGGFLVVPALVLLGGLPMKQAVGTSLLVISLKSAAGFLGYRGQVDVPWVLVGLFTGVGVVGILLGAHLVRYVPQHALQRAFAILLLVTGGLILYQNLPAVTSIVEPVSASARALRH